MSSGRTDMRTRTIDLTAWAITSTHGPDCADCRWAVRRAEDRIEDGRGMSHTKSIRIRYYGHDATAKRRDAR